MRLRNRILLIIVCILLVTVGLLVGYYNLFLSKSTAAEFEQSQAALDQQCAAFAAQLPLENDFTAYLTTQAKNTGYQFQLTDVSGQTLFSMPEPGGPAISINATAPLQTGGRTLLLRVTQFISIKTATAIPAVRRLFTVGVLLLLFTLPAAYVLLYVYYVRPIVRLQRDMEQYRTGVKPSGSNREDEIGKLQNAFVRLTDDLDSEKQKQNQLIASISHDIKTPLTSVMGYAERMQTTALTPERARRYVSTIYDKAQTIRDLVDEFDDYLSCNMPATFHFQHMTCARLFALLAEEYEEELSSLGVAFALEDRAPDAVLQVDLTKLRRVFGNLISNSLKHFRPEGDKRLSLSCHREADRVFFCFADNGEGVAPAQLSRIFDPLFTSDAGRSVAGLGLSICREVLEAHGGEIWVEPNSGGGLRICFSLPALAE